jgi:hypothetical protein
MDRENTSMVCHEYKVCQGAPVRDARSEGSRSQRDTVYAHAVLRPAAARLAAHPLDFGRTVRRKAWELAARSVSERA